MEWKEIWESEKYKAEIYDNCSVRIYVPAEQKDEDKVKIEVDGTRWVGNTGGFHVYKYFRNGHEAKEIISMIDKYNRDEASEDDITELINAVIG